MLSLKNDVQRYCITYQPLANTSSVVLPSGENTTAMMLICYICSTPDGGDSTWLELPDSLFCSWLDDGVLLLAVVSALRLSISCRSLRMMSSGCDIGPCNGSPTVIPVQVSWIITFDSANKLSSLLTGGNSTLRHRPVGPLATYCRCSSTPHHCWMVIRATEASERFFLQSVFSPGTVMVTGECFNNYTTQCKAKNWYHASFSLS